MTLFREVTEGALAAVAVTGRTSFSWFGVRAGDLPSQTESAMTLPVAPVPTSNGLIGTGTSLCGLARLSL